MEKLDRLFEGMIAYNAGDPARIQHLTKVHSFARLIGLSEGLEAHTQFCLEAAAYVHDIGIRNAEKKYGSSGGKLQEQEGPPEAERLLQSLGFAKTDVERICWLVGHHHTYQGIDGPDYQILVEADFLVNLFEEHSGREAVETALERVFRTKTGKKLCREMFLENKTGEQADE